MQKFLILNRSCRGLGRSIRPPIIKSHVLFARPPVQPTTMMKHSINVFQNTKNMRRKDLVRLSCKRVVSMCGCSRGRTVALMHKIRQQRSKIRQFVFNMNLLKIRKGMGSDDL